MIARRTARALGRTGLLVLLGVAGGCELETRPPSGSRRDDSAVGEVVTVFYRALAARDTTGLRTVTFPAGSAMLDATGDAVTLVPITALLDVPGRRTLGTAPRQVRTEVRMDGGMAVVRVVLVAPSADGAGEVEATDVLTLGRREGGWRIAHSQLGGWRTRSAP